MPVQESDPERPVGDDLTIEDLKLVMTVMNAYGDPADPREAELRKKLERKILAMPAEISHDQKGWFGMMDPAS